MITTGEVMSTTIYRDYKNKKEYKIKWISPHDAIILLMGRKTIEGFFRDEEGISPVRGTLVRVELRGFTFRFITDDELEYRDFAIKESS